MKRSGRKLMPEKQQNRESIKSKMDVMYSVDINKIIETKGMYNWPVWRGGVLEYNTKWWSTPWATYGRSKGWRDEVNIKKMPNRWGRENTWAQLYLHRGGRKGEQGGREWVVEVKNSLSYNKTIGTRSVLRSPQTIVMSHSRKSPYQS